MLTTENRARKPGPAARETHWVEVCGLDDILPGTGVAAMLFGVQVALIRPWLDGHVYAISNFDPFSRAFVMARGIVGDRGGELKIASPIYKQSFCLATGQCLDDPSVRLPVYPTRVVAGRVEVDVVSLLRKRR